MTVCRDVPVRAVNLLQGRRHLLEVAMETDTGPILSEGSDVRGAEWTKLGLKDGMAEEMTQSTLT